MKHAASVIRFVIVAATLTGAGCADSAVGPAVEASTGDPSPPSANLRTAMCRTAGSQPVQIHLNEARTTTGEGFPDTTHNLDLIIDGVLAPHPKHPDRAESAQLRFHRVRLTVTADEPGGKTLSFDSRDDKPGNGNPLADLMSVVGDATCDLEIGPSGRLRSLHGLDGRWSGAGMLLGPPALMSAQWLFRDIAMEELVSEALFPPMPAGKVRPGDQWEVIVPANLPLAARLDSAIRCRLVTPPEAADPGAVEIRGEGTITPAKPIIDHVEPAMKPGIRHASHVVRMTVNPDTHGLAQESTRELELHLRLVPPTESETLEMKIKQTRNLSSTRGKLKS